MSVRKLELLSPAKNLEVGIAAIMAGADAVYIGGPSFGARAAAGNSMEDIAQLCAFAHRFGAHVYLTVNTLLYDEELAEVEALIAQARLAGVDALIVQDPAILTMDSVQDLELHASTQMNIDTLDKVEFCRQLGFGQIVVPREFSLEQIKQFTQAYPELRFEVFVSGAMCVSVSGICYISELMTDRSANRGACAQICRLPMDMYHHDNKHPEQPDELIASGHLLSMKDNLRLHELEDLVAAGASSFKIEGRLKDRDYVVNQVAAFSERLDKIIAASNGQYQRASYGYREHDFVPNVAKTFNRGFTSSFLQGANDQLINARSPKSTGELMGTLVAIASTATAAPTVTASTSRSSGNDRASNVRASAGSRRPAKAGAKGKQPNRSPKQGAVQSAAHGAGSFYLDLQVERTCLLSNGDSFTFFDEQGQLSGFRVNKVALLSAPKGKGSAPATTTYTAATATTVATVAAGAATNSPAYRTVTGRKAQASQQDKHSAHTGKNTAQSTRMNAALDAGRSISQGQTVGRDEELKLCALNDQALAAGSTVKAQAGQVVRLFLLSAVEGLAKGVQLYRNVDTLFIKSINMPKALVRKLALSAQVSLQAGLFSISFKDELGRLGSYSTTVDEVAAAFQAENSALDISKLTPLDPEVMSAKLVKLGDEYLSLSLERISFAIDQPSELLIPLSSFNKLRRLALQNYQEQVALPRYQCQAQGLRYLDGSTDAYIYLGLAATPYAHLHSATATASATSATADASSTVSAPASAAASATASVPVTTAPTDANSSDASNVVGSIAHTADTMDNAACADAANDTGLADAPGQERKLNLNEVMAGIDERLIFNERARAFYQQGAEGQLEPPNPLIAKAVMTCRNCLIKNHALCHDQGGSTTGYYLKIGKHSFDIVTNCRRCLMYLVPRER